MMRRLATLSLLFAAVACGGGSKNDGTTPGAAAAAEGEGPGGAAAEPTRLPDIPASPAAMPDGVLATVSIGDPQGQLTQLGAFGDAVQPGIGAMVGTQFMNSLASIVGVPGLAGYDLAKPVYVVFFDPQRGGADFLLVVAVQNEQQLVGSVGGGSMVQVHDGYAAVGRGAALMAGSAYALSNLAKTTPPKEPHAIIHMNRVMDSYRGRLEQELQQSMGKSNTDAERKAAEGMLKAISSIERIEASIEASATSATVSLNVFPVQGSTLAAWSSAQQPAAYDVAARLPKGPWLMVAAGRIDWSPMKEFWTAIAQAQGNAKLSEWFGAVGKEVAFAVWAKKNAIRMAGLVEVVDGKLLTGLMADYIKEMAAAPKKMDSMQAVAKANAHQTGGAKLHGITIQPGADADPEAKKEWETLYGKGGMQSYFGLAGSWLVFALDKDKDAKPLVAKVVQGAKSKKAPKSTLGAVIERAIADSKARKESGLMVFDLAEVATDPVAAKGAEVTAGLAFEGPVIKTRVTVPPQTGALLMKAAMGGGGI